MTASERIREAREAVEKSCTKCGAAHHSEVYNVCTSCIRNALDSMPAKVYARQSPDAAGF